MFLLACMAAHLRAAPTVTASLDRSTVPLGETVNLAITFRGAGPNSAPQLPPITGVTLGGVSTSSQFQLNNGQMDSLRTFTYRLIPQQEGEVTIPAMQFTVGGQVQRTDPLTLKVTPRSEASPSSQQAFLRLIVPKKTVYVGEAFPLEIHLYWNNARDIRSPQLEAEGFSLIRGQDPPYQEGQTTVNNTPFNLVVFKMAATAARSGQIELGPATCNLTLLIPLRTQNRRDPFRNFFGSQVQRRPVKLTSDPVTMEVLPLPRADVPPSFNGAVGRYQLDVSASPTNLAVGDPITVRTRIRGQGHLDALLLPEQPQWRGFKLYPPSDTIESNDPLGLRGTKVFEQVVIPQNHDLRLLPSLEFSYFDVGARAYRTLTNAPIPLNVGHARQTASPIPALTNGANTRGPGADDIIHIRPQLKGVVGWQTPLLQSPGFLLIQALPLAGWLGLVARRRWQHALERNPRLRRQREVARRIRAGLQELNQHAQAQDGDAFFATLFRLLQEQMGERLDLPASAITEAVIDERLARQGFPPDACEELHALFQTCNQARYAPQQSVQELNALIPRVEKVLAKLQKWNP